jgi:hypothetical protein
VKRGTKHSTESGDGSQAAGDGDFRSQRRPPRRTVRGANNALQKAAATKARRQGVSDGFNATHPPLPGIAGPPEGGRYVCGSIWGGGTGGYGGGLADGVAVDDEFDAAIALAAFGGVVGCYGLGFAKAASGH